MSLDRILRAIKLDSGATITKIDATATLAANSDSIVPTQKAVKTYVDTAVSDATGSKGFFIIPLSFETTEIVSMSVYPPMDIRVDKCTINVTLALAGTDAGTVTLANSTGSMDGVVSIPASSALGYEIGENQTTNSTVLAGGTLTLTPAKTTKGGRCIAQVNYTVL